MIGTYQAIYTSQGESVKPFEQNGYVSAQSNELSLPLRDLGGFLSGICMRRLSSCFFIVPSCFYRALQMKKPMEVWRITKLPRMFQRLRSADIHGNLITGSWTDTMRN